MAKRLFTSESVTEGHPDKICDQISDAVLDAILEKDPNGRVACETTVSTGLVHIMGEITTSCYVDIPKIAREVIRSIGYDRAKYGFDCDTCGVIVALDEQSADIAMGVAKALEAKEHKMSEEALDAIGADMGISRERVRQLEHKAFGALRKPQSKRLLQSFHEEIISRFAWMGTGWSAWYNTGASSVERAAEKAECLMYRMYEQTM